MIFLDFSKQYETIKTLTRSYDMEKDQIARNFEVIRENKHYLSEGRKIIKMIMMRPFTL